MIKTRIKGMFGNFYVLKSIWVCILHRIFCQVFPVTKAFQSDSMSLGCLSIVTVLTAALRIDGASVDNYTVFMTC